MVPSLISSHDYYQTELIPIVALSTAPLGERLRMACRARRSPGGGRRRPVVKRTLQARCPEIDGEGYLLCDLRSEE